MRDVDLMAEELRSAQRDGVACIVDAGLEGAGVDLDFIRAAAMKSGLPVVKGAGFYAEPFYPQEVATMSEEQLVRALVRQADDYPAGVFGEIGSWDEITAVERKVFRAVGKAHVATNLPIFTHTGIPGKAAIEQLDILEDAGVDPKRVCIGHLGNLNDPNVYVHKTICRRGGFVGFDRQGGGGDANVVPLVIALLDAGFADHVLISGDASRGYARPVTAFLPKLKAAGADDATLQANHGRQLAALPRVRAEAGAQGLRARPLDFRGDAAWTDSPAVACAAMSESWRRDSQTGSAFVTASTAASIMGPCSTPQRYSRRSR